MSDELKKEVLKIQSEMTKKESEKGASASALGALEESQAFCKSFFCCVLTTF